MLGRRSCRTAPVNDPKDPRTRRAQGIGIAIGTALGVSIGLVMDNIALGIAIGIGIGVALGQFGARSGPPE